MELVGQSGGVQIQTHLHFVQSQNIVYLQLQTQVLILFSPSDTTYSCEMRICPTVSEMWCILMSFWISK